MPRGENQTPKTKSTKRESAAKSAAKSARILAVEEIAASPEVKGQPPKRARRNVPPPKRTPAQAEGAAIAELAPTLIAQADAPILKAPFTLPDVRPADGGVVLGQPSQMAEHGHFEDEPYRREYAVELVRYFAREPTNVIEHVIRPARTRRDGVVVPALVRREVVTTELPTFAGFAVSIGVYKEVLEVWAARYPEFSRAMDIAKSWQENILVVNGLAGRYNTSFSMFAAKNLIGWRERFEVEASGDVNVFIRGFTKSEDGLVVDIPSSSVVDVTPRRSE